MTGKPDQPMKRPSLAGTRQAGHEAARKYLHAGNLEEATRILEATLKECGPHVGLLADLAACYFHQRNYLMWQHTNKILRAEFEAAAPLLTQASRIKTAICIGKFLEEEGAVARAAKFYGDCLSEAAAPPLRLFNLIQAVRLATCFNLDESRLPSYYRELVTIGEAELGDQFEIEYEHALLLAELSLFDETRFMSRLERVRKLGSTFDLNLCIFDAAETLLLKGLALPGALIKLIEDATTSDPYEEFLKSFVTTGQSQALSELPRQMVFASSLRILTLVSWLSKNPEERAEANRRFLFMLESLEKADRMAWLARRESSAKQGSTHEQETHLIIIDPRQCSVEMAGRTIDMRKKPALYQVLMLLAENPKPAIEVVVERVWKTSYDRNSYNRLRVLTQRLNSFLRASIGTTNAVSFTQERLLCSPDLRFELRL